jgi:predicted MPP superfamily phosphohydrolase
MKEPARGRRSRTKRQAFVEAVSTVLYKGDWPARLWGLVPGATRVELVRHTLAALPPGSSPLRLAFISDLHIGPTTPDRLLDRAFEIAANERPDVLLLGGDYVYLEATPARAERLRSLVERVPARTKLAVLGNHDLWTVHTLLEAALESAGAEVLVNRSVRLPEPHDAVHVVGLDEPWSGEADPVAAIAEVPPGAVKILLCHAPDGFPLFPSGFALYLAGHTHGGHIALPGGIPIVLPGPGAKRWPRGMYKVGDGMAFVSKGVGGAEVPMRTFATPEVVLFTLVGEGPVAKRADECERG